MASKTNTLDWEEARAEFFQENFLPSESLNSNTSTEVRRQNEARSGGGAGASSSFRDASVGTLESHSSRMSNVHINRSQASTTPADAITPQDDSPPSVQPSSASVAGTSSRATKARMRAAVQGLEEEDESDEGEIEVVDFTDGK